MADLDLNSPEGLAFCTFTARGEVERANFSAALLGSVIPASLTVLLLSTPRLRRQTAFHILTFALVLLFARCILALRWQNDTFVGFSQSIIYSKAVYNIYLASYACTLFIPWLCDCALLSRLLAFHPSTTTQSRKRVAIMAFPLAAHIPRLPLIIAVIVLITLEGETSRYSKIYSRLRLTEGALQLAVNCYCSGFLLRKANQFARADYAAYNQQASRARIRLRHFTESILFTFVPASAAQLGYFIVSLVALAPRYSGLRSVQYAAEYLRYLMIFFSLNFGLLAVWWSTSRTRDSGQTSSGSYAHAAVKDDADMSFLDWALGAIEPEAKPQPERLTQQPFSELKVTSPQSTKMNPRQLSHK